LATYWNQIQTFGEFFINGLLELLAFENLEKSLHGLLFNFTFFTKIVP